MRIVMLVWDYYETYKEELHSYTYHLGNALENQGHEVHLLTRARTNVIKNEKKEQFTIHELPYISAYPLDFVERIIEINRFLIQSVLYLKEKIGTVDVIHNHQWLTGYSAQRLSSILDVPMVYSVYPGDYENYQGLSLVAQRYIASTAWMLMQESEGVITIKEEKRIQIHKTFSIPLERIWVMPMDKEDCIQDKEQVFYAEQQLGKWMEQVYEHILKNKHYTEEISLLGLI